MKKSVLKKEPGMLRIPIIYTRLKFESHYFMVCFLKYFEKYDQMIKYFYEDWQDNEKVAIF